ncbi:MAG TPA: hypothetical protein VFA66_16375 [Gaiellaceae bacterium]|nr:hypothetical protein [Gaiellaceae bacterium]
MKKLALLAALLTAPAAAGSVTSTGTLWPHVYAAKITGAQPAVLNGTWRIVLRRTSYTIQRNGAVAVSGSLKISGKTVAFHDVAGPFSCRGSQVNGTYAWRLRGVKLTLARVRDACPGRQLVLAHAFTRIA